MDKFENMLRTIDVNVANSNLTDAEFRRFVSNTLSGLPLSSKTSIEILNEAYDAKANGYESNRYYYHGLLRHLPPKKGRNRYHDRAF